MIHNSSVINKNAKIGKNVKVGPFCYIGPQVQIADDVELISNHPSALLPINFHVCVLQSFYNLGGFSSASLAACSTFLL